MDGREVVLVTGGTGAIGVALVERLARSGHDVTVLARRPPAVYPAGVTVVGGDITHGDELGLQADVRRQLQRRATVIVHTAALTRFDAEPEAARAVNVEGTRNLLGFAAGCVGLRRLSALSTVYVAGRREGQILEAELEHAAGFVNVYEASEYEAEVLLRQAMPQLPIAVCRLSTAIGEAGSGRVERPAAIHHAIRFLYHSLLPMIPGRPDSPVDLIATDYAVDACAHLANDGFEPGRTWHLCAGTAALGEADLIDLVVESILRHRPAWRKRAIARPDIVELATFELFRESVEAVADPALRASVAVLAPFAPQLSFPKVFDDRETRARLAAAGVERPPIRETMSNVVRYLIEHDWAGGATSGVR